MSEIPLLLEQKVTLSQILSCDFINSSYHVAEHRIHFSLPVRVQDYLYFKLAQPVEVLVTLKMHFGLKNLVAALETDLRADRIQFSYWLTKIFVLIELVFYFYFAMVHHVMHLSSLGY